MEFRTVSGEGQGLAKDRLFIFDCDGVLVDSEPLAASAYVRVYARHGLTITPDVVGKCFGMKQADIFARIHDLTGQDYPRDHVEDVWLETKEVFTEQLEAMKGVAAFLSALDARCCVASSSSLERIQHSLSLTGLISFFGDDIFSSSMVKHGKPAPDLFLFAASKMGFAPSDCLVIEDSLFGAQAGRAAGMTVFGFTGGGHSYVEHETHLLEAGADKVFSSFEELSREAMIWANLPKGQ
ncbi:MULTISPECIES: HAD family hydrolase [unclassified Rhizobium]|uniref:HAD family hydrolase n=1 Tax=unclassified Rhizobium TaxID=2613769 RepID=UPI001AD973D9|nr:MULTISPECIES: HAD family hydrolase [unclassified Rhizobium]QXZ99438.1 HAD family hydrolase [Rhizobium sp. B230/85]MBO9100615.1 HAD family hydrolase [Rhizobium sp. L58/93]MBO9136023.1 HAD family hydrolase [Rhizobium sp. B209b/85]MBO9171334.1 HAD family hydrolase [Rhizobium sp. L245/93]MBO9187201.1 HAD family hydrolase [Rhizobium sp. E27B/91]